jgi:hypothetical protein
MKTRLFFLLFVGIALCSSLRAELLVYRESERALVTVAGREVAVPVTTYWVYDTITGSIEAIGAFKVGPNKIYAITNGLSYVVRQGIAGRLGNYTVFARTASTNDDPNTITSMYFAKGRESSLDLGNGNTANFPRSMKAVTRALQLSGGQLGSYESSSTLVLQSTETKTANAADDTAAIVIERIRQRLEAQGYVAAP